MANNYSISVCNFIADAFNSSGKNIAQITDAVGFDKTTVFEMIIAGKIKLPIQRIESLAQTLAIDAGVLLDRCMTEYTPEAWDAIQRIQGTLSVWHQ